MRTPLPQRMWAAAVVLEEANRRCGMPPRAPWTPSDLRREADVVAAEDNEQ